MSQGTHHPMDARVRLSGRTIPASITRRDLLKISGAGVTGAALLGASGCSEDADSDGDTTEAGEYELIMAHQLSTNTPYHEGLQQFADLVEEKTDGRITSRIHPNAEIGNEIELFQGLQEGTVDVSVSAPYSVEEFFQGPSILSLPFMVTSFEHRDRVIESEGARTIEESILDGTGVHIAGYFGGGVRNALLRDAASSIADLRGRLFRSPPGGQIMADCWAAVGVQPTVIPYSELYNALQQGVVDGYESDPAFIIADNMYEVAPYLLHTWHEVTIRYLTVSQATLDRLPDNLADAVLEAGAKASEFERDLESTLNDDGLRQLEEDLGMEMADPPDVAEAVEAVEPVWQRYAEQTGVEDILRNIRDTAAD